MSVLKSIFSFFGAELGKDEVKEQVIHECLLIDYLLTYINEKSHIEIQLQEYKRATTLAREDRGVVFLQLYLQLETFILSHKTPIVTKEITSSELKEKIKQNIDVDKLEPFIRVFFITNHQQLIEFCNIVSSFFLKPLRDAFGESSISKFVQTISAGTLLESATFDGYQFDLSVSQTPIAQEKIVPTFQNLNNILFEKIVFILGKQRALELKQEANNFAEQTYSQYPFLTKHLPQLLPS